MSDSDMNTGELVVENNGRIGFIGEKVSSQFQGRIIDLSDCLVMPGFVNAHCHLTLSALKGKICPTNSFVDWVLSLVELDANLSEQERLEAFHSGAREMLDSGVTTFADYLGRLELLPEYAYFPLRQIIFLEAIGFQSNQAKKIGACFEKILQAGPPAPERISLGIAPHAPYSVSPSLFRILFQLAKRYNVPISSHVAELLEEEEFLKNGSGDLKRLLDSRRGYDYEWIPPKKSSLDYLADIETLDSMVAIHLNHIDGDKNFLKSHLVSAVFCPRSTSWFCREKYMDVDELMKNGVTIGLGTDSLASNKNLNFLDELRAAESMIPNLNRKELLLMATRYGAEAMGLETGVISTGRPADLIAFRIQNVPERWSDVPFFPEIREACFSMIGGKIIFEK